jgi:hypothetical protein
MIIDNKDPKYQQCSLTVMDNIADPDIRFDDKGICNYYYEYQVAAQKDVLTGETGRRKLEDLVNRIKADG